MSTTREDGRLSREDRSKDDHFRRLGTLAEEMIAAHGKDFAMGALVLAARFIAEGKPLAHPAPAAAPGTPPRG